jgi:hypothetical protein
MVRLKEGAASENLALLLDILNFHYNYKQKRLRRNTSVLP